MTTRPRRLQRRRAGGWRMPEGARYVGRGSRWGNRFRIEHDDAGWWCMLDGEHGLLFPSPEAARREAVRLYREDLQARLAGPDGPGLREALDRELRGRDLACWCAPHRPCHADVLLEIANA